MLPPVIPPTKTPTRRLIDVTLAMWKVNGSRRMMPMLTVKPGMAANMIPMKLPRIANRKGFHASA